MVIIKKELLHLIPQAIENDSFLYKLGESIKDEVLKIAKDDEVFKSFGPTDIKFRTKPLTRSYPRSVVQFLLSCEKSMDGELSYYVMFSNGYLQHFFHTTLDTYNLKEVLESRLLPIISYYWYISAEKILVHI